jgi:ATP-dependent DNA helicase RecG
VIKEAITNAVQHRDYRLNADIHVRLFENRIEVDSPGVLPGPVTVENLRRVGSRPRNRILVDQLREFADPPNLDAGEGVRMMFDTMQRTNLYPPVYFTEPDVPRESVVVHLLNAERASIWDQVSAHLERHGTVGNAEVRRILRTDDPVKASRLLSSWLGQNLLVVANPEAAKQHRRYRRPGAVAQAELFSLDAGKQPPRSGK